MDELEDLLPSNVDIRGALSTLTAVALSYLDRDHQRLPYRILPPIREFTQRKLPSPPPPLLHALIKLHIHIIQLRDDPTSEVAWAITVPERLNIHAVLKFALGNEYRNEEIITATLDYANLIHYMGEASDELVIMAQGSKTDLSLGVAARCLYELGACYVTENRLDEAELHSRRLPSCMCKLTMSLVRLALSVTWAVCQHTRHHRFVEAEKSFVKVSELFSQAHNVSGQASALGNLGELHLRQDRLDQAEALFVQAYELYSQTHNVGGQARALAILGDLHMRRDRFDEAETSLVKASELFLQVHSVSGRGRCSHQPELPTHAAGSSRRGGEVTSQGLRAAFAKSSCLWSGLRSQPHG